MTLASRQRRPSYAEVTTPKRHSDEGSSKSNVKVVVRIRPENTIEKNGNHRIVVRAMNEHVLVFDPNEQSSPSYGYRNRHARRDIRRRPNKDLKFAFDYVFGPGSANHEIYTQTTKKILDSFLEGYNCSVFAYGATGAGKTHTMLGNPEKPGVMYLTMMELYNRINAVEGDMTCDVAVSYLEVYNEQIRDLLMGGKTLPVREDAQSGVVVPGLSLHKPRDADELLHMLQYGNQNRTQHPTDANAESSRSHAVFQVFVKQRDRTANISAQVKVAKLCLVDLAGSERATVTKNRGNRFREGANINRSLLALGNVINALADPKYKGHVPYRDSKLTRLLKDSLGGNCQTVMIAAVSPSGMTYEDTYNTLKYADRAKNIQSQLKKNVLNVDFHVARYGQIVEELRKEILELKEKLRFYEEGKLVASVTQTRSIEVCRIKEKLDGVFCTRLKFSRDFLDAELKSRDLEWRIHRKDKCLSRMDVVGDNSSGMMDKVKKMISTTRHTLNKFHGNKEKAVQNILENKKSVEEMEKSVKSYCKSSGDNLETENLQLTFQVHQSKMALTESQYCVKYLTKVVKSQEREIQSSERMILNLLNLVRQQHLIIKGSHMMTSDLETEYQQIRSMAEGREVSFADQTFNNGNQSFSLSGLLDFKGFPSEIMAQSNAQQTDPVAVSQSVDTALSSSTVSILSKTPVHGPLGPTTDAGHTPFPSKTDSKDPETAPSQHYHGNSVQQISTSTRAVSPPLKSVNDETVVVHSSNLLPQRCLKAENKAISQLQSHGTCKNQNDNVNSTFTLDSNDNEDHNSTFTLMETNDKDPELIARTPVIEDKFCRKSHRTDQGLDDMNRGNSPVICNNGSLLPCVDVYTQQTLGSVNVSLPSNNFSSNQYVTSPCNVSYSALPNEQVPYSTTRSECLSADEPSNQTSQNDLVQNSFKDTNSAVSLTKFGHCNLSVSALQSGNVNIPLQSESNNQCQTLAEGILGHVGISQNHAALSKNPDNTSTSCVSGLSSRASDIMTQTVTKSSGVSLNGIASIPDGVESKSHAVRSITFGGMPCTPEAVKKVRSYSDVVQTPPMTRTPLREMNSNTPLSEQNQRPAMAAKMMAKRENLFGANEEEVKETSKRLNQLGLPSLMEKWHTDPRKPKKESLEKPSYMQPTKAVRYRNKPRNMNNENLEPTRVPVQHSNKTRVFKRSQSVNNLPKRGWQI